MELTKEEKIFLLRSARSSIRSLFEAPPAVEDIPKKFPSLMEKCGTFVTLTIQGNLRGCIGHIISEMSLYETVLESARLSAINDPRFPPLTKEELQLVTIEISVLSIPVPLKSYEEIRTGIHGLILEEGGRAVLLPQVAVEHGMNTSDFLTALCEKARISPDAWQKKKLNLSTFTAVVFSENKFQEDMK